MQKMKLLFIMLVTLFRGVVASDVAVRTTFDAIEPNKCTDEEFDLILRRTEKRQLRAKREMYYYYFYQPWYCFWVCRDFPSGWCKCVYPSCYGFRRMEEQQEQLPISASVSPPASVLPPNDRLLDEDLTEACQQKMADVDAAFDNAIANMTDVISTQCINTLNSPRHHVCMDMLNSDTNKQVESLVVVDTKFAKVQVTNNVYFGTGCSSGNQNQVAGEPTTNITYCFTVCNKGDTFLNQFLVKSDSLKFEDGSIGRLAPQACKTLSVPSTIGSKDSRTKVTVTAYPCDQNGNILSLSKPFSASAESTVKVSSMKAQFKFSAGVYVSGTRECNAAAMKSTTVSVKANTMVTYCFRVENVGTLPMSSVISDADKNFELAFAGIVQPGQVSFASIDVPVLASMKPTFSASSRPAIDGTVLEHVQPTVVTMRLDVKRLP